MKRIQEEKERDEREWKSAMIQKEIEEEEEAKRRAEILKQQTIDFINSDTNES